MAQRLVARSEELDARDGPRWAPPFESAAVLCEELSDDYFALAGTRCCASHQ